MKISVLVSILACATTEAKKDKYFYCQTCAALVEESFFKVSQVGKLKFWFSTQTQTKFLDRKKTINTGSSRIDPNGEMKERKKQWRLSETHLTEVTLMRVFPVVIWTRIRHARWGTIETAVIGKMHPSLVLKM